MDFTNYPGSPFPLGATWDGQGVNFALFSENAVSIELCLFNKDLNASESIRIPIQERDHHVWHVYVPDLMPGQLYGYRVYGPYDPVSGFRFNPNKLLIDPYAKAISGNITLHDSLFGYDLKSELKDISFNQQDSAHFIPKSMIVDQRFDWEGVVAPKIPYHKMIIYEAHVKGLTILHPDIPEEIRGTYAAIGHPVMIEYFHKLGVNAIELMPVHHFAIERHLKDTGLTNYWGYNTIGFFAPDIRFAKNPGNQVVEFKQMVKELHRAGIEVILDVVYNHTAEGNQFGPTLSFRGIDNFAYYRLAANRQFYMDYTGTGNTLNAMSPNVLRLIMDSLRYWIQEMHVDGFRFDLASALARELHAVDRLGSFFDIIHQDPIISQVKLIAEPWDVGEGGYQVGKFPPGWAEWNGKYRDCIRDYWRGANSMLGEFAERFTGSSDLYRNDYRLPTASVNFVTAHDGFTLHDLVTYNEKHNLANGENNNDGESHNRSWNCGIEGETDNVEINELRNRQKRNFLTTLFLSQGVAMLVAGDELGKTQMGNNNPYCQDNETSWINWANKDEALLAYTQKIIQFTRRHPVFNRRGWFIGQPIKGVGVEDIVWFVPDGKEMPDESWAHDFAKSLGVFLNGLGIHTAGPLGERVVDNSFYIMFNAHNEELDFKIPRARYGRLWQEVINTAKDLVVENGMEYRANAHLKLTGHSIIVLQLLN